MSDYTVYKVIFILKKTLYSHVVMEKGSNLVVMLPAFPGEGNKFETLLPHVKKTSQGTLNLPGIPLSSALPCLDPPHSSRHSSQMSSILNVWTIGT